MDPSVAMRTGTVRCGIERETFSDPQKRPAVLYAADDRESFPDEPRFQGTDHRYVGTSEQKDFPEFRQNMAAGVSFASTRPHLAF